MIILPRQARDKHRESTQKRVPFFLAGSDHPTFDALAKMGSKLTGYAQVFGHFYQGPVDMSPGGECAWAYQHRGIWVRNKTTPRQ